MLISHQQKHNIAKNTQYSNHLLENGIKS